MIAARVLIFSAATAAASLATGWSRAETPGGEAPAAPSPHVPPAARTASSGTWGWYVVVSAVALGLGTTIYGLTIQCSDDDQSCARRASLAIWGGVGIASVGTALGVTVIQLGRARAQVTPALLSMGTCPGFLVRGQF